MPTPLDRALHSRSAFLGGPMPHLRYLGSHVSLTSRIGFAGVIAAVGAWTIWGSESLFPKEADPKGGV